MDRWVFYTACLPLGAWRGWRLEGGESFLRHMKCDIASLSISRALPSENQQLCWFINGAVQPSTEQKKKQGQRDHMGTGIRQMQWCHLPKGKGQIGKGGMGFPRTHILTQGKDNYMEIQR